MGGDYIETPIVPFKRTNRQAPKQSKTKTTKKADMSKDQFKKAKAEHKAAIKKLRGDIKKHKLLMKQSKLAYKLSKMKEKTA